MQIYPIFDQTNVAITGGTMNGVVIGATTPAEGHFTNIIESNPQSGEHRIKGLRLSAAGEIIVTYDGDAEP